MPRTPRQNPGFTLIEILVVLAILAILAGVLVPSIANQVSKSDVTRVESDLGNLRTGIESFLVDMKRFPGDIEDLVIPVTASDDDIFGNAYPTGLLSKWKGPYIDVVLENGDSLGTGFGASILDDFTVDSIFSLPYLGIQFKTIEYTDFTRIDAHIDTDTSATDGRLRLSGDTAKYLVLPAN